MVEAELRANAWQWPMLDKISDLVQPSRAFTVLEQGVMCMKGLGFSIVLGSLLLWSAPTLARPLVPGYYLAHSGEVVRRFNMRLTDPPNKIVLTGMTVYG